MLICEAVEPDGKTCRACEQYKRLDEYYPMAKGKYGRAVYCKACSSSRSRSESATQRHKWHLKRYGLTPEKWQAAWDSQDGLCALCTTPLRRGIGGAATDHDHGTDKFRAILCALCNTAIGKLQDDPALMRKAADYVEFHRAKIA